MTETDAITQGLFQELLTSVKTLQANGTALKSSRATGGNNLLTNKSGHATLPENGNETGGNPRKRQRSGYDSDSSDNDNPGGDDEGDNTFKLSEDGGAFIEAVFKTRLDDATRTKKRRSSGFLTLSG